MAQILVIDDDQIMRDTLLRRLAASGHKASTAVDAAAGLTAFRNEKPEIVLLDINLPDMDGISVMEEIKSHSTGAAVIIMTGQGDVKTSIEALRKGAFDYLLKPFEREELDICIQRALWESEMQRRLDEYVKELESANRRLKEAQAQLIQSEKMSALGQLAAGMAHEVNNPLTSVCMNVAFLLEEIKTEKQVRQLKIIEKETDRAAAIVRSVLLFSRKPKDDKREITDINASLNDILLPVENQLKLRNIKTERELGTGLPQAAVNVNRIQQAFLILINNARDAMPAGGKLTLRTLSGTITRENITEPAIVIEVTDTGPGIPPENAGKLFVPFFTTKDPGKGVGLGLYIARTIVDGHSGIIEAVNNPGGGATFRVRLPAAKP